MLLILGYSMFLLYVGVACYSGSCVVICVCIGIVIVSLCMIQLDTIFFKLDQQSPQIPIGFFFNFRNYKIDNLQLLIILK